MRELKFRAWDSVQKFMLNADYSDWEDFMIEPDGSVSVCYESGGNWSSYRSKKQAKNLIVMQFTGLLDKNGKEVFEGDIVKYFYGRQGDLEGTPLEVVKVVIFHNGSFEAGRPLSEWVQSLEGRLQYRNSSYYNTHMRTTDYFTEHDFEVIGNIHENSDLLRETIV